MIKVYTKNPKIEKVENRNFIFCDRFLLVNYYPTEDKMYHYAFIEERAMKLARSRLSVGVWKYKSENK